jgi:hypothetical protein
VRALIYDNFVSTTHYHRGHPELASRVVSNVEIIPDVVMVSIGLHLRPDWNLDLRSKHTASLQARLM